jgi:hypothetical protein
MVKLESEFFFFDKVSSSYLVNGGSFYPDQVETHVPASQPLNHSGNNLVSTT